MMNKTVKRSIIAAVAVAVTVVLAACTSPSSAPSHAATTQAGLVAASKKEGQLVVYANAVSSQINAFTAAFMKKYPWIKVKTYDLEDPVVFSRYAAEHATGTKTADVLIASAPNLWASAVKKGEVQDFVPAGIKDFPSFASQGKGIYVMSPDPAVTIYNKKLLSTPPKTVAQIAEDAAAGKYKVATYTIDNDFGYAAFYGLVQREGWSPLKQLGKTAKTLGDGNALAQDVQQGGFAVAVFESGLVRAVVKPDNPVIGWEYTTDYTPLVPRGIAISSGASNPNSARLFMNYLFSDEGQQTACTAGFEAYSNTFTPTDGCTNTLKELYSAIGGTKNAVLVPINQKVADDQAAFTQRWKAAFTNR